MGNLTKCKDCGKEISKKATACPNCGAPVAKQVSRGCAGVVILVALIFVGTYISTQLSGPSSSSTTTSSSAPKTASSPTIDKSPEMQAGREELIQDLQRRNVFGEIECRSAGATAIVDSVFYSLDFEDKQKFVGVVYAFCFDGTRKYVGVTLRDIRTNKEVGTFSRELGLELE